MHGRSIFRRNTLPTLTKRNSKSMKNTLKVSFRRQKYKIAFLMVCSVLQVCAVKVFVVTIVEYLNGTALVPQLFATGVFVILSGWACIACFFNLYKRSN